MVERAVLGRSGDAGAVRGRTRVARMSSRLSTGSDSAESARSANSTGVRSGDGGAVAGKSCRSLDEAPTGYGGSGDSVGEEKFWRMAKRRCRRWCNGEWLICSLSLSRVYQRALTMCVQGAIAPPDIEQSPLLWTASKLSFVSVHILDMSASNGGVETVSRTSQFLLFLGVTRLRHVVHIVASVVRPCYLDPCI